MEVPLPTISKVGLEYDSYENRKFVHEFDHLIMKYNTKPTSDTICQPSGKQGKKQLPPSNLPVNKKKKLKLFEVNINKYGNQTTEQPTTVLNKEVTTETLDPVKKNTTPRLDKWSEPTDQVRKTMQNSLPHMQLPGPKKSKCTESAKGQRK